MTDTKRFSARLTYEEKEILDRLAEKENLTQGEMVGRLLRIYKNINDRDPVILLEAFKLSDSELSEVEQALNNSYSSLDEVAKDGLLQRSRYLNSIADKQANFETMTDEQLCKANYKGAANYRINQAIDTIIEHNNKQSEKSQKVCITKGILATLTGSNTRTIKKHVEDHQVMIDDHNQLHSLTRKDNYKGKYFSVFDLLGVKSPQEKRRS